MCHLYISKYPFLKMLSDWEIRCQILMCASQTPTLEGSMRSFSSFLDCCRLGTRPSAGKKIKCIWVLHPNVFCYFLCHGGRYLHSSCMPPKFKGCLWNAPQCRKQKCTVWTRRRSVSHPCDLNKVQWSATALVELFLDTVSAMLITERFSNWPT